MSSALKRRGSTRRWRQIRGAILRRDGFVCQMMRDGARCGRPATDVNHKVPRRAAPPGFPIDAPSNLEAACPQCNRSQPTGRGGYPRPTPGQLAIAAALDRAGLAHTVGPRTAAEALAGTGHPWRFRDVDAACAWRRHRGPLIRV